MRPRHVLPSDPTAARLRALFRQALRLSVLSAAAAGCTNERLDDGGAETDSGLSDSGSAPADMQPFERELEPVPGFGPVSCDPLDAPSFPESVDFVALRSTTDGVVVEERASVGFPCHRATDSAACLAELAVAPTVPPQHGPGGDPLLYLTITRGDDVQLLVTSVEVRDAIAPIESENEAVLLARLSTSPSGSYYGVDCKAAELSGVRAVGDGYEVIATETTSTCPVTSARVVLGITRDGDLTVKEQVIYRRTNLCIGRRPPGLCVTEAYESQPELGAFFAQLAELEAASITAFRLLTRELRALGAPAALIARARQAARDEVRHTRAMSAFARRFGAEPRKLSVARQTLRSALALALDNAVEGCVRETFGALYGAFQAEHAGDLAVREVMRAVAEDETRHASLAHDLASWLAPRLDQEETRAVHTAQSRAIDELRGQLAEDGDSVVLRAVAGIPTRCEGLALFGSLSASLWTEAAAA